MKSALTILVLLLGLFVSPSLSQVIVNGEVFIVTRGGNSIKLGLVTVLFLTTKQYQVASDTNSSRYRLLIDHLNVSDSTFNHEMDSIFASSQILSAESDSNTIVFYQEHDFSSSAENIATHKASMIRHRYIADSLMRSSSNYRRFTTNDRALYACINASIDDRTISVKTNSDGRYSVKLKKQKYYVFAQSSRSVGDSGEQYTWLFEYTPDGKPLFLSNDNLSKN